MTVVGAVLFSVDRAAVELLARTLGLTTFVETGTFRGDSLAAVRDLFTTLHSAEISAEFVTAARARFHGDVGVSIHAGASPDVLRILHATPRDRVFYWLDAHWCESGDTDAAGQCPLLAELAAIGTAGGRSVIAIDDARLFLAPPTSAHAIGDWPHFDDVLAGLRRVAPRHRILVVNDVIWAVPAEAFEPLLGYAARHGADWLAIAEKARTYDAVSAQLGEKDREIHALAAENQARLDLIGRLNTALDRASQERSAEVDARCEHLAAQVRSLEAVAGERGQLIATLDTAARSAAERAALAEDARDHLRADAAAAAARAAEADARWNDLSGHVRSLEAVAEERAALIATLHTAAGAAAERAGALDEENRQLLARTQALEAAAADVAGQAAAAVGRADAMEQAANERLAVIERIDGLARATSQRAEALDELARTQAAALAEWQARAAAAEQQLAEVTAAATAAVARAREAEQERDARQLVIDELVKARDAFAAALGAVRRSSGLSRFFLRGRP